MNMDTFYQNTTINNINMNSTVSQMLSYFDSVYIENVVDSSIEGSYRPFNAELPNIVIAYENRFKIYSDQFPSEKGTLLQTRRETYKLIIDKICYHYKLSIVDDMIEDEDNDYYSIANILYGVLVSEFTNNFVTLFIRSIEKDKANIYQSIMSNTDKVIVDKTKNYTIGVNKKIYSDPQMAIIQANINSVIDILFEKDITFENIMYILLQKEFAQYITTRVQDAGDLYQNFFVNRFLNPDTRPSAITSIKLKLHEIYLDMDKAGGLIDG